MLNLQIDGMSSEDVAQEVGKLWARYLLQSHSSRKIALIYLVNDLIQKCVLEPRLVDYHVALRPPSVLAEVLPELFRQLADL